MRPASTMARVEPRAAPLRNESRALSKLGRTPPWPCLNRLPHRRNSMASLSGRSASHHDLHTRDAARRLRRLNDPAIFATTSYGRADKSWPSEQYRIWRIGGDAFPVGALRCCFEPLAFDNGRDEKREPSDRPGQVLCFIFHGLRDSDYGGTEKTWRGRDR
jgi:hypothetical protein